MREEEEEEEEDFVPAHCLTTQIWVPKAGQWLRNIRTGALVSVAVSGK